MSSSPVSHHSLDLYLIHARWLLWFLGRVSVWRKEERRLVSGKPKLTQGPPHRPLGLTGQNVSVEEQRECRGSHVHPTNTPGLCSPPSVRHHPCLFLTQIKSMRLNLIQIGALTHLRCHHYAGHVACLAPDLGQRKTVTGLSLDLLCNFGPLLTSPSLGSQLHSGGNQTTNRDVLFPRF